MRNAFKLFAGAVAICASSLFAVEDDVPVVYEAEFATVSGAVVKGHYVDYVHSSGDYIEWVVEAGSTGGHLLEFNYYNGQNDRPLEISVDGVVVDAELPFPSTGGWNKIGTTSLGVALEKGFHKIRATAIGFSGANVDSLTVTGKALVPIAPPAPVGDTAIYEAEDAEVVGADVKNTYVDYNAASGESITWHIDAATAGIYKLEFIYFNGSSDRPLEISVDNNRVADDALSFPGTGGWTVAGTSSVLIFLTEGSHVVSATSIGLSGPNMDALAVTNVEPGEEDPTPDPNTPPRETDDTSIVYEAEFAAITGAVAKANYVDYVHSTGDAIEWTIEAGTSTTYELSFRYANGSSDRPLEIKVDGEVVAESLSFPGTGGWSKWETVSVVVELSKGFHKVTATAIGKSGGNIDSLTVIGDSTAPVDPIAEGDPVRYEAEEADVVGAEIKGKYVDFINASDETITWHISVPADGFYDLEFIYSNGGKTDRPLEISADDKGTVTVITPDLPFPSTGAWKTYGSTSTFVFLTEGVHFITAKSIGRSGGNIDALVVKPSAFEPEPDPAPEP